MTRTWSGEAQQLSQGVAIARIYFQGCHIFRTLFIVSQQMLWVNDRAKKWMMTCLGCSDEQTVN